MVDKMEKEMLLKMLRRDVNNKNIVEKFSRVYYILRGFKRRIWR